MDIFFACVINEITNNFLFILAFEHYNYYEIINRFERLLFLSYNIISY